MATDETMKDFEIDAIMSRGVVGRCRPGGALGLERTDFVVTQDQQCTIVSKRQFHNSTHLRRMVNKVNMPMLTAKGGLLLLAIRNRLHYRPRTNTHEI